MQWFNNLSQTGKITILVGGLIAVYLLFFGAVVVIGRQTRPAPTAVVLGPSTPTAFPPTRTPALPADTPIPPTSAPVSQPTGSVTPTATSILPTATSVPPTATSNSPTPTFTTTLYTATSIPPTSTQLLPTPTPIPLTPTPVPTEAVVTLNINWGVEPPTLDPALATDTASESIIEELFLGLTDLDDETMEAIPELATEWSANAEKTIWTFTMRDDVPWVYYNPSTGQVEEVPDDRGHIRLVNAHDVVYGVKRTCDPRTGSDYAYILYVVKGCQEVNTADSTAENFQRLYDNVGVRAVDDFTVEFQMDQSAGFFPQIASMAIARPMPQWIIANKADRWIEPGFIQTNGPYVIAKWVHGIDLTLEENPLWYGWKEYSDQAGNIERVYGVMVDEKSTAFALYEDNRLDTAGVPLEQFERAQTDPQLRNEFVSYPINCSYYYGFTTRKVPTDDVRVRKALSLAIDRKTLVEDVTRGGQISANTFTNPLNFGSLAGNIEVAPWALPEDMGGWGYDDALAEGKELLDQAGYPTGVGLDILLMHNVSKGHTTIARAIRDMWKNAYPHIDVTIKTQEWQDYLSTLRADTPIENMPHVWRLGWCADYPHAHNWLHEVFNTEFGANRVRMDTDDPQVGRLIREFDRITTSAKIASPDEQLFLYKQAEQSLVDKIVAIAPIYYYTEIAASKPWLDRLWGDPSRLHIWRWEIDFEAKKRALQR